jgi:hypothetical protein
MLPPGYDIADEFSSQGGIVSVAAGVGFLGVPPTTLVSRIGNAGIKVFFKELACRVVDLGSNQIFFGFRRNGSFPVSGLIAIPGVVFDFTNTIQIDSTLDSGLFDIVASNISGTGLPGAGAAVPINCQAYWTGNTLRTLARLRDRVST